MAGARRERKQAQVTNVGIHVFPGYLPRITRTQVTLLDEGPPSYHSQFTSRSLDRLATSAQRKAKGLRFKFGASRASKLSVQVSCHPLDEDSGPRFLFRCDPEACAFWGCEG